MKKILFSVCCSHPLLMNPKTKFQQLFDFPCGLKVRKYTRDTKTNFYDPYPSLLYFLYPRDSIARLVPTNSILTILLSLAYIQSYFPLWLFNFSITFFPHLNQSRFVSSNFSETGFSQIGPTVCDWK